MSWRRHLSESQRAMVAAKLAQQQTEIVARGEADFSG